MKTTEENNKIIAEFMELIKSSISNMYWTKKSKEGFGEGSLINLNYNSDWNLLMEVVEKISNIKGFINIENDLINMKINAKIEDVYNACLAFIEWYNKNAVKE